MQFELATRYRTDYRPSRAFDTNLTAECFNNCLRDTQTQAAATFALRLHALDLDESLEHPVAHVFRSTWTFVTHPDPYTSVTIHIPRHNMHDSARR